MKQHFKKGCQYDLEPIRTLEIPGVKMKQHIKKGNHWHALNKFSNACELGLTAEYVNLNYLH